MKLVVKYNIPNSQKATWMLSFIGEVRSYYDNIQEEKAGYTLNIIAHRLYDFKFKLRKAEYSCSQYPTEINGNTLKIFNMNKTKTLIEISYE